MMLCERDSVASRLICTDGVHIMIISDELLIYDFQCDNSHTSISMGIKSIKELHRYCDHLENK